MQGKYVVTLCVILCLISLGFGYQLASIPQHRSPRATANVFLLCETAKGTYSGNGGNLITNIGERYVRNILGFNNVSDHNATKWISLSNVGSPLASWTELDTEIAANGFTRAIGTVTSWMNGTDYAYNVSKKFTATGQQQLQTAGLQWNDTPESDNNLFAAATFSQTTFETDDNLTITWVITWDAN
jgi:hypothetical protein